MLSMLVSNFALAQGETTHGPYQLANFSTPKGFDSLKIEKSGVTVTVAQCSKMGWSPVANGASYTNGLCYQVDVGKGATLKCSIKTIVKKIDAAVKKMGSKGTLQALEEPIQLELNPGDCVCA